MPFNIHFGIEGIIPLMMYLGMFAAFLASAFWRPSIGIYVLAFALPLQTTRFKLHGYLLGAQFLDILLLGVMLGLLFKGQKLFQKHPLNTFLLMFAVFYYFSLWEGFFFVNVPLPLWITDARFSDWKNYVEMFLLALIVASTMKEPKQVRNLVIVMCLSVLLVNRNYISMLADRDLTHFDYDTRSAGLLGYAGVNGFAAFEAMFSSFLLGLYALTRKLHVKLMILVLLATCVYCLLFSFSRGGYAGFLAGLVVVGLLRARILLVVAALLLIGWQTLLPNSVQERVNMTTSATEGGLQLDSSAQERVILWEDALALFKQNPVTGTGFATYEFMGRVGPYRDTHNYYLKVLAETGIVGFILYLVLLWKLQRTSITLFHESNDALWKAVGLGFAGLVGSAIVLNLFGDRWTYQQVDGYLWIFLGCVIRGLAATRENREQSRLQVSPEAVPLDVEAIAV